MKRDRRAVARAPPFPSLLLLLLLVAATTIAPGLRAGGAARGGVAAAEENGGVSWYKPVQDTSSDASGVPVFIMMPLTAVSNDTEPQLKREYDGHSIEWCLDQLKAHGVHGLMVDVWFGLVERDKPRQYRWKPYLELVELLRSKQLKLQAVLSFHQCGGNVGDKCFIPLPKWIHEVGERNSDIFFKDIHDNVDLEYVSWGVDDEPLFHGRTMLQVYRDFMADFRRTFEPYLGSTIVQVQVGLGPAGELRYPAYQLQHWSFCGVGAFQCYDRYLRARLRRASEQAGMPAWGHPPYAEDVGNYSAMPDDTLFFRNDNGLWSTQYGAWFLSWYSQELIDHADRVLGEARSVFAGLDRVTVAAKQAGVHWHVRSKSHGAELTAGYFNTRFRDGYLPIFRVFAKHNTTVVFTCMEMRDKNQPQDCFCSPEELVGAVIRAAVTAGCRFAGENAISFYDADSYRQISGVARAYQVTRGEPMEAFTYLRWTDPFAVFIRNDTRTTVLGSKFFEFLASMSLDRAVEPAYPVYAYANENGNGDRRRGGDGAKGKTTTTTSSTSSSSSSNAGKKKSDAQVPAGETGGQKPDTAL